MLKIYNSLSNKIEDFIPNEKNHVKLYTCGPTVYHFAHIGNLRTYIVEDILEKSLKFLGYKVSRVMNITDVGHLSSDADSGEDKMLTGAKREKKSVLEIAAFYTEAFKKDCESLNIKWPDIVVPATSCVDGYIDIISKLLENNFAYISGGNVYFDTSKLIKYYTLTNQNESDLIDGVREGVEKDLNKKNANDFVLWFTKSKFSEQELKWNSPWGEGYPGWHIECSAIAVKHLGEHLDIHCGGIDNKFPHHTNEIAQTESYIGHKWCNYWVHVQHLLIAGGKMSKSSGEFLTLSLLKEKGYNPMAYRYFCLQSHYRKQLMFGYDSLDNASAAYTKLLNRIKVIYDNGGGEIDVNAVQQFKNSFKEALENDLNTSLSLTVLYDVLKADINNNTKLELIKSFDEVLSLNLLNFENSIDIKFKKYIEEMIEKRTKAKKEANYKLADEIRNELLEKGIILKDQKETTTYELK